MLDQNKQIKKEGKELLSFIEIIKKINYHFLPNEKIKIEPRENGRIHLVYGTHRIFITENAEFTGACNGIIHECVH